MLPHLGQGAAQSIEDAAALGVLLSDIVTERDSGGVGEIVEARLKLYQSIRKDRVTAIQLLSEVPGLDGDFHKISHKWAEYLPGLEFPRTCYFPFPFPFPFPISFLSSRLQQYSPRQPTSLKPFSTPYPSNFPNYNK